MNKYEIVRAERLDEVELAKMLKFGGAKPADNPDFIKGMASMKMLGRIYNKGMRHYIEYGEDDIDLREGVTSILGKIVPESDFLKAERARLGSENYNRWMNELADQGTFVHIEVAEYLYNHEFNIDTIEDRIYAFFGRLNKIYDVNSWARTLTPKIISLIKFMKDYNVAPIAVEMPVYSSKHGYAGMLDLICEMDFHYKSETGEKHKNGKPMYEIAIQREYALADFKSGTSGFFLNWKLQKQMYAAAFIEMFGEVKGDFHLINIAPKKHISGNYPDFRFNDEIYSEQVTKNVQIMMDHWNLLKRAGEGEEEHITKDTNVTIFEGILNGANSVSDITKHLPLKEYAKKLKNINQLIRE